MASKSQPALSLAQVRERALARAENLARLAREAKIEGLRAEAESLGFDLVPFGKEKAKAKDDAEAELQALIKEARTLGVMPKGRPYANVLKERIAEAKGGAKPKAKGGESDAS